MKLLLPAFDTLWHEHGDTSMKRRRALVPTIMLLVRVFDVTLGNNLVLVDVS